MPEELSYHNRGEHICQKIRSLLISLDCHSSKYREVASKAEYWIEYALRERFITVGELVEGVSYVAWDNGADPANVGRFLREFRDAPQRSEQAICFVVQLCRRILRWFAVAVAQDVRWTLTPLRKDPGPFRPAFLVGCLIEQGLLSHELVKRHLAKPLINHDYSYRNDLTSRNAAEARTMAIDQLFTAGNSLLRGLLDPEDVQACFEILDYWGPAAGVPEEHVEVRCIITTASRNGALLVGRNSVKSMLDG